jgi:peptide/nickel transport system substrate-binding protein
MFSQFHKIFDVFNETERRVFQGALTVFAITLVLNGANIFYERTMLAPIEGGSYTEGVVGQPIAINPLLAANNDADRDLLELVFSDLSELAEGYSLSEDKRVWTVTLLEDLFWSDGEPLTTDDILFTLETIQNPETHSGLFTTWQGVQAARLSQREIRFTLRTPYAFFFDNLQSFKIAPQHIFGAIPNANLRLSDYNLEPIGSGPYEFVSYEKRKDGFIKSYRFAANVRYAGEAPLIKEFNVQFYPNYDEAISAFNRKEIDGLGGLSAPDVKKLKIGYQLKEFKIPRYYAVFFNQSTSLPLKSLEVRQALVRAADRKNIVARALNTRAIEITGPLYPGLEGYEPFTAEETEFSLQAAEKLLEDNLWERGADGVRAKKVKDGELRLAFEIIVPNIDFLVDTASILAEDWGKIGVALTPVIMSPPEVANESIKTRNYQMILFGNILKNNPDVFSFWHSSERFRPGLNLALYENKKADVLLESVRQNFDPASRAKDLRELQRLISEDAPAAFLFSPHYLYAGPKTLGGLAAHLIASPANRFDGIETWYLKTARVFK